MFGVGFGRTSAQPGGTEGFYSEVLLSCKSAEPLKHTRPFFQVLR